MANPYFISSVDNPKLVGRTICCKFNANVDLTYIDSLNNVFNVEIEEENPFNSNRFLLRVKEHPAHSTLEIANIYYGLPGIEYCHPNFFGGLELNNYCIYDYYWEEQWNLHRIFEAGPESLNHKAYEITRGDTNIIVAVLDIGLLPHEDLSEYRFVPGYDFTLMDNNPAPCTYYYQGYHGIGVAGIIGASHNRYPELISDRNTGIYGISPLCKIMPLKIGTGFPYYFIPDSVLISMGHPDCIGGYFASTYRISGAFDWAWTHGADILSCSWGGSEPLDDIYYAIKRASILGRDGKGCGIFFSSGNTPGDTTYYPAMYPEVISVASLHPDDSVWSYCTTAKVDVVAPSGWHGGPYVWTLDLMDSLGYNTPWIDRSCGNPNDIDYNCVFGGTSAAQPVAAGVASLVLARKPDLTHDELHDVIRLSADPNLYETISAPPHQKYGYGMVHPFGALLAVSRGDADNSGEINIMDANYIINWLYRAGPAPIPDIAMADSNCDGNTNILDAMYVVNYLYRGGAAPPLCYEYVYQ